MQELIYRNILALCKERNIPVSKLEREVGLGNGTVGSWAKRSPSIENVGKVAKFFGVTIDSLCNCKAASGS